MGGSLELRSRRGRTEFELRLPAASRGAEHGRAAVDRWRRRSLPPLVLAGCGDEERPAPTPTVSVDERADRDHRATAAAAGSHRGGRRRLRRAGDLRERRPGVVTVSSIFGGGDATASILGGGGGGRPGLGLRHLRRGRDPHQRPRRHRRRRPPAPRRAAATRRSEVYVQFADRNQVEAEIVGFDPFADVALLKVDPDGLDLNPLPLGSENDVEVGEDGRRDRQPVRRGTQSLSVGIVSASDRSIESLTDFRIDGAIQTDASINPGNSGGPLLDSVGEVVGINQQIQTTSGGNEGVGFAVPIDLAERSLEQLRDDGEVSYAYAGVTTQPLYPQLAEGLDLDVDTGALVSEVVAGSPADEAGLQAGDDPIRFQGQGRRRRRRDRRRRRRTDRGQRRPAAADLAAEPGDEVTLEVIRDGDEEQVEITLGERPRSESTSSRARNRRLAASSVACVQRTRRSLRPGQSAPAPATGDSR